MSLGTKSNYVPLQLTAAAENGTGSFVQFLIQFLWLT